VLSVLIAFMAALAPAAVSIGSIIFVSASVMLLRGSSVLITDDSPPFLQILLDERNQNLVFGIAILFTVSVFQFLVPIHQFTIFSEIQILSVASKSLQRLFIRLSMFALGVRSSIAPANLRRLGLGAASEKAESDQAVFAPGDIVLANFTNMFEVFL
jgi:hypothetical protein